MTAPFFPGIRPRPASLFATDFSEYTTLGVQPPDWTKVTRPADFTAEIENASQPGSISGKVLRLNRTPQSRQNIVWNKVPGNVVDAEVLILQRKTEGGTDNHSYTGAMLRSIFPDNTGDTQTGYLLSTINDSESRAWSFKAGVQDTLDTFGRGSVSNLWFWSRIRVVGTSLQMKYWRTTDSEPVYETFVDPGTPITAGGLVALGNLNFLDVEVGYFAVSIGSPGMPPAAIALPV